MEGGVPIRACWSKSRVATNRVRRREKRLGSLSPTVLRKILRETAPSVRNVVATLDDRPQVRAIVPIAEQSDLAVSGVVHSEKSQEKTT